MITQHDTNGDIRQDIRELTEAIVEIKENMVSKQEMQPIIEAYQGGKWAFAAISLLAKFIMATGGSIAALYAAWLFIKHQINT